MGIRMLEACIVTFRMPHLYGEPLSPSWKSRPNWRDISPSGHPYLISQSQFNPSLEILSKGEPFWNDLRWLIFLFKLAGSQCSRCWSMIPDVSVRAWLVDWFADIYMDRSELNGRVEPRLTLFFCNALLWHNGVTVSSPQWAGKTAARRLLCTGQSVKQTVHSNIVFHTGHWRPQWDNR